MPNEGDENGNRRPGEETHDHSADGTSDSNKGAGGATTPNSLSAGAPANPLYAIPGNPYSGLIGPGSDQDKINQLNNQIAQAQLHIAQAQGLGLSALIPYQQLAQQALAKQQAQKAQQAQMTLAQWAAMRQMALSRMGYGGGYSSLFDADYSKIPDAGISIGELTGWRGWLIDHNWPNCRDQRLQSITADARWDFEVPMQGDPEKYHQGVYSFKSLNLLDRNMPTGRYVLGTIKMWGRVIEHDSGYRAEFAKVSSIISVPFELRTVSGWKLKRLRQMYNVGAEPK